MTGQANGLSLAAERLARSSLRPVLVAVVGPPGAGKSTIVAALADGGGVPVLRLRETVRQRPELLAGFAPSTDPLGWISLEAVRRVMATVLVQERFGFGSAVVLLDNFPGTAAQLDLLAGIAGECGDGVALLEIQAAVETVIFRVAQRRVCLHCGPDAHAPAVPAPGDMERCSACGAALTRRDTDVPRLHGLRLARYTENLPEITQTAARQGIAHVRVDADAELAHVCASARDALIQLTQASLQSLSL